MASVKLYSFTVKEMVVASKCRDLGLVIVKSYSGGGYTVYNHPELEGAWTYVNEIMRSYNINDIEKALFSDIN